MRCRFSDIRQFVNLEDADHVSCFTALKVAKMQPTDNCSAHRTAGAALSSQRACPTALMASARRTASIIRTYMDHFPLVAAFELIGAYLVCHAN